MIWKKPNKTHLLRRQWRYGTQSLLFFLFLFYVSNAFAVGDGDWVYVRDYDVDLPIYVQGTYMKGSNVTEPKPQESKYLKVDNAGTVIVEAGVGFFLNVTIKKRPPTKYYITVEYPNPEDPARPLINDVPFNPLHENLVLSSPEVIKNLAGYGDYDVIIRVYKDENSMELVDTLTQTIRSYVDTREEDVRIFEKAMKTVLK